MKYNRHHYDVYVYHSPFVLVSDGTELPDRYTLSAGALNHRVMQIEYHSSY